MNLLSHDQELRDEIAAVNPEAIFFDGFDDAIIGTSETFGKEPVVCYDRERCLEIIQETCGGELEDAIEYFEFNVAGAYVGEHTPVFLTRFGTYD